MHTKSSFVVSITVALLMASCHSYPGFEETKSGIYKRLNGFDDCSPALIDADFFIMQVSWKKWNEADSGYAFELHHGSLNGHSVVSSREGNPVGLRLAEVLRNMKCGDDISLVLPFAEMDNSYLCAYTDTSTYALTDEIELRMHLVKTFAKREYLDYLMHAAQQGELNEEEAIELYLMNNAADYLRMGKCFIVKEKETRNDSISAGSEITISYTTHLFNEQSLDTTTVMQFQFGKPGQIIDGFQYGLSFLNEGEKARIYLPSQLAFGENGNSSGLVPPHTPVYFDVMVLDVKTTENSLR
ncbi:MAG: FKBP-type peptidyl-prolyl cis-trans isomerase [Flavobacteriales bacterium]